MTTTTTPSRRIASAAFRMSAVRQRVAQDDVSKTSPMRREVHESYTDFYDYQQFSIPQQRPSTTRPTPNHDRCFTSSVNSQASAERRYKQSHRDSQISQNLLHIKRQQNGQKSPVRELSDPQPKSGSANSHTGNISEQRAVEKARPQTTYVRPSASIHTYKGKITNQQRTLFQLNVNNQQMRNIDQINAQLISKDYSQMNKHLASIKHMSDEIHIKTDKVQVDNELIDVHINQAQASIDMLQRQISSDKKALADADMELKTYLPIQNLEEIYFKYAYVDINQVIQQIDLQEQSLVKNVMNLQDQEDQIQNLHSQIEQEAANNQEQLNHNDGLISQNKRLMGEKIKQLELLNKNLTLDTYQAEQARFKSIRLNNAIIQFNRAWGTILDYKFLPAINQISNQRIYNDVRKNLFRVQSGARKYVETKQSIAYKKLSKLILQIYKEYPEKPSDTTKEVDDSITQDIPAISQYICQVSVKQSENIVKLQMKNKTLNEEINKLQCVGAEIKKWNNRVRLQLEKLENSGEGRQ